MNDFDQLRVFVPENEQFTLDDAWDEPETSPQALSDSDLASQGVRRWFDPSAKVPRETDDQQELATPRVAGFVPGVDPHAPLDILPALARFEGVVVPLEEWQTHEDRVDDTWFAYALENDRHLRLEACRTCPLWDANACRADPSEPTEESGAAREAIALPSHCPHAVGDEFDTREAAVQAMVSRFLTAWGGKASRSRLVAAIHHRASALGTAISFAEIQSVFDEAMVDAGARWNFANVLDCGSSDIEARRSASIEADAIAASLSSSEAHDTGMTEARLVDFVFTALDQANLSDPPTPERERELIKAAQDGDSKALHEMWLRNVKLAHWAARKAPAMGASDFVDRWSAAILGLRRPIEKFDLDRGFKFSTYASQWTNQATRRQHDAEDRLIRIPSHASQPLYSHVVRARMGTESFEELVAAVTRDDFDDIYARRFAHIVLDDAIRVGSTSRFDRYVEVASDDEQLDESAQLALDSLSLRRAFGCLTAREQRVLKLRYGLWGEPELTLEEVGAMLGVTRERVRQLQNNALKKLQIELAPSEVLEGDLPTEAVREERIQAMRRRAGLPSETAKANDPVPEWAQQINIDYDNPFNL